MTAFTAIFGTATLLLIAILIMGFDYTFVKVFAGAHLLMFLLSGIGLVKLKTENDE